MFWGLALENGKRYTQVVDKAFHVSMASLEQTSGSTDDSYVSIMFEQDKAEFLLCTLQYGKLLQQPLDLNFMVGDTVTLYLDGHGIVYLTGYIMEPEDEEDYSDEDVSENPLVNAIIGFKSKAKNDQESDASDMSEEDAAQEQTDSDSDDDDSVEEVTAEKGQKRKATTSLPSAKKAKTEETDSDDDDEDEDDDSVIEEKESDDDEDFLQSFSKKVNSAASPAQQQKGGKGNQTPGGPKVIKTPQAGQQQGIKGNQQQQQQQLQKSPGGSPAKPKQDGQKNGKGGQQQPKSPANVNTPAPKTPALTNGDSAAESPVTSAKKRKRNKKKGQNASQLESPQTPASQTPNKGATPAPAVSGKKQKKQKAAPGTPAAGVSTPKPQKASQKLPGGTQLTDITIGSGPVAKPGKHVQVYYCGKVGNTQFDSCLTGKPFKFRLGAGEVIKGWDAGIQGMKVGGKRTLVVPPNQAYGNTRTGPIAPNSTLNFEVQLLSVK